MHNFECPKPKPKCFDCPQKENCFRDNSPSPRTFTIQPECPKTFNPLSTEISSWAYRILLLVSEDFKLTKPELTDAVYYASRFKHSQKGGRGKSRERIYAILCMQLLRRDKRPIYKRNKLYYDSKYHLDLKDTPEISSYVLKEVERINDTIPALRWQLQTAKGLGSRSFPEEQLDPLGS